jgi:hypothetical protein
MSRDTKRMTDRRWLCARAAGSCALLLLLIADAAHAQDPPLDALPDSIADRIIALHNAPGTTRFGGEVRIPEGTTITGNVAIVGGPAVFAGRVEGMLIVINGDVTFEEGATVTGATLVVGGSTEGEQRASLLGGLQQHPQALRFRQDPDGLIHRTEPPREGVSAGRDFPFGRTDIFLAVRTGYNRVEGLPISFGPRVRFGTSNPTSIEAFAIYRTRAGLDVNTREMGYALRAEQYLGGRTAVRIGVRWFSEILPIETRGLSDRENSLSTFLLHRDYRDAYESDGWNAYVHLARPGTPTDLTFEYRAERHRAVSPANPWSIVDNDEAWRPNPLVAEGMIRSVAAILRHDTRNESIDPATGWDVRLELERGLGGGLETAELALGTSATTQPRERFTAATIDVRRYVRFTPYSRMGIRVFAAGSVDGTELPPQRQHVLGGEASLPGYRMFEFDCAARREILDTERGPFFPYYGCDRVVLVQMEYQAGFPFARRLGEAIRIGIDLGQQVRWAAFFDAGRAWNELDALDGRGGGESDFSADAGLGIRIGELGFYWAYPLSGSGKGLNFFVRIGRRL